jgi:two-component system NtrC family sensor kinase
MHRPLAPDVHQTTQQPSAFGPPRQPHRAMKSLSQSRFIAVVLAILTVSFVYLAWLNYDQEQRIGVPQDGVWWVESGDGRMMAQQVNPEGPGARAGIRKGDLLEAINGRPVTSIVGVTQQLYLSGVWSKAGYTIVRDGVQVEISAVLEPADKSLNNGLRLIALIYLGIGLYVLMRRWTAPKSMHFYVFCLVSFVFYSFKFTGKLNPFDTFIYWSNVVAWLLQPALFLHFALTFPETKDFVKRRPWLQPAVYLPGVALLIIHVAAIQTLAASELLRWNLDRLQMLYLAVLFAIAAAVLWHTYWRASSTILRLQMKWVTRGTVLAIAPYTLFYVIPYLMGALPTAAMKVSVLSLIFLPLTFGYAIFRYRLMDVDIIFKRGMAYTLATAAIVGLYFGVIALLAQVLHARFPVGGTAGLIVAIIVTAVLFDPVKRWIHERLDRFFYRKRYDYRKTLLEFGRDLSSETDLDRMLSMLVDRLAHTLLVDRIVIFLAGQQTPPQFTVAKSFGVSGVGALDLSFLSVQRPELAEGHLFFENTGLVPRETEEAQETIRRLDLNYYIPCAVQNRTIAILGLGRTTDGDLLSSEDVELMEALAGYIGIAIQNARLYASLQKKAAEYERLKDFNENIVESINVGVLVVDLQDRIEFWNSQMEVMYARSRSEVLGKPISEVFPAAFTEEFYRLRHEPGIRNLYKFRLETPAGDARITNIAVAPLVSKIFQVLGRLIIVDDISDRIELETQLAQADKMSSIGLLAAGVAHEVNTPLAVISSYAQMLAKQLNGDDQKSALLEKITRQTFRASEIVNHLLNFSRTSGTEFSEVSVNKVIEDTLALLEHQFKSARIRVDSDLAPGLPDIHGNAGKLQQVFLNLFLNARDAMPEGGTLRVVTANGAGVSVSIADTGSGIAAEHLTRIYDPFFTTKQSGQKRGTGLGLAVTYGIIQEHAGKIWVESKPGQGTTFHLDFPLIRKAVNV